MPFTLSVLATVPLSVCSGASTSVLPHCLQLCSGPNKQRACSWQIKGPQAFAGAWQHNGGCGLTSQMCTEPSVEPAAAWRSSVEMAAEHQILPTAKPAERNSLRTWKVRVSTSFSTLSLPQVRTAPQEGSGASLQLSTAHNGLSKQHSSAGIKAKLDAAAVRA